MAKRNKADRANQPLFRVKLGHVLLAVSTALMIVGLAGWSLISMQAHANDNRAIFAQESDSAALTFVQRESFSVLLKIEQWADGFASTRDVQISRAMLGQRLGVETQSGTKTFDITSDSYRDALAALDPQIREFTGLEVADRMPIRRSLSPIIEEFSEQTRALSATFQQVTRDQIQAAANERANAEFIQSMILLAILLTSASLATWISIDIVKGFRRATAQIALRQKKVDESLGRLLLVQSMDERSRELIQQVQEGMTTEDVVARLKEIVDYLLPGNKLRVEISGYEVQKFEMRNPQDSRISERDFGFLRDRALEVLSTAMMHDQQKQDIRYALQHDNLTGLANRKAFTSVVEEKVQQVNRVGGVVGLFYMDIDRFGDLNSSLGYQTGDLVLMNMAFRISDEVKSNEFAARLSSDEFAVVGIYKNEIEARSRALALQTYLTFDMPLDATSASITVSMGCAISNPAQADEQELPRWASLAIHLAKKQDRRSSFVTYNSDDHSHLMTTWQEEIAVRNALATGEFKVFYQPIVSLEDRKPVGFEALIRWQRPGHGLVYPDQFLPLVNSAGLAAAVGADVISEALRGWREYLQPACNAAGIDDPYISINLEAVQVQDDTFVTSLLGEVTQTSVPHQLIQLEITEHALVGGDAVLEKLEALRATGIKIALDDFGTGFSNLSQTLMLPLDVLKLDKSLLLHVDDEDKALRMVEDITKMAQGQNLVVIAEGVETDRIAVHLNRINVDRGQGYLFGKAMPGDEIAEWATKYLKSLGN